MLQIETKLKQLKLRGMSRSWQALAETRRLHDLSFAEGMELLLQAEEEERSNSRFERLLRGARFRYRASMEELDYSPDRGLDTCTRPLARYFFGHRPFKSSLL